MNIKQKIAIVMTLLSKIEQGDPEVDDKVEKSINYLMEVLEELK